MKNAIKTCVDPVANIKPETINQEDILAIYGTISEENDVFKLIKITIVKKGNIESVYHEGLDSSDINNTFRNLLEKLGENFICSKKYPIIINSLECDKDKSDIKRVPKKKKNVILTFKDGTVLDLKTSEIAMKCYNQKEILKPKNNFTVDFNSGSM